MAWRGSERGTRRTAGSILTGALLAVAVVTAWLVLAPVQLGGQVSYVIVTGNSMQPTFRKGDLAIVRRATSYQVGDVVTYANPTVGTVIHRIVATQAGAFVLKGDHNTWLDSYQPQPSEVGGRLWVIVPRAGSVLQHLRDPAIIAALVGAGSLLALLALTAPGADAGRSPERRPRSSQRSMRMNPRAAAQYILSTIALLGMASAVLAAFAFTRPVDTATRVDRAYEQSGSFQYRGAAPSGIYDGANVESGDPIFLQLTKAVTASFDFRFESDQPHTIAGTAQLNGVVSADNGWKRTIPLQAATSFTGDTTTLSGVLDLAAIQAMVSQLREQTGLALPDYTLAITAQVDVTGTLAGQSLRDDFAQRIEFGVDDVQAQLRRSSGAGESQDPLRATKSGALASQRQEPNALPLLGLRLPVSLARSLALGGLAVAALGGAGLAIAAMRTPRGDEPARIAARYGPMLCSIARLDLGMTRAVVDVASFDDLARLADQEGRMILHEAGDNVHRYYVQSAGTLYRYACPRRAALGQPKLDTVTVP